MRTTPLALCLSDDRSVQADLRRQPESRTVPGAARGPGGAQPRRPGDHARTAHGAAAAAHARDAVRGGSGAARSAPAVRVRGRQGHQRSCPATGSRGARARGADRPLRQGRARAIAAAAARREQGAAGAHLGRSGKAAAHLFHLRRRRAALLLVECLRGRRQRAAGPSAAGSDQSVVRQADASGERHLLLAAVVDGGALGHGGAAPVSAPRARHGRDREQSADALL